MQVTSNVDIFLNLNQYKFLILRNIWHLNCWLNFDEMYFSKKKNENEIANSNNTLKGGLVSNNESRRKSNRRKGANRSVR